MLGRMLRQLVGGRRRASQDARAAVIESLAKLKRAHERAPLEDHLRILFEGIDLGGRALLEITQQAIAESQSHIPPLKALHRRFTALSLGRYFLYSLGLEGRRAECGVYSGCSALTLCLAARGARPGFDGTGFHLVDSFAGLSEPDSADAFVSGDGGGSQAAGPLVPEGKFAISSEYAKAALRAFPGVVIHQGWIPEVLAELPEGPWSFVHVDVDLHLPTRACLEYFFARLCEGGVIVCDDYGSQIFPGARRAWDEFCEANGIPFVVLPTGQSVLLGG